MLDFQLYRKLSLTAATLMVLGTLAGCGGGGNGNPIANNLTQAQAQQLGSAVSNDVSKALASVVGNPAVPLGITTRSNMVVALQGNNSQVQPEQVTCSSTGSCTVDGTYTCPDSGSIMVSGTFMVIGMTASGTFTLTPSDCSDGTLVIDPPANPPANPNVTVKVTGNDSSGITTVNLMITGDVTFSPVQTGQFPSGSCSLSVNASVSVSDSSGSVTSSQINGSICGQTINAHVP